MIISLRPAKALKDHTEKERALWASFSRTPFERGVAKSDLSADETLALLDYGGCLELLKIQTPAPDFTAITTMQPGATKATLFAHQKLTAMDSLDRIRTCYQHACLCYVCGWKMTNASLRERFGIKPENTSQASRLIREAVQAGVVKLFDPDVRDRDRSYVPFWA